MTNQLWSWALTLAALVNTYLLTEPRLRGAGWVLGISLQFAWLTYGFVSAQYGFVAAGVAFTALNVHGLRRHRRERAAARPSAGSRHDSVAGRA